MRSYGTGERQDKTSIDYLFSALQANRFLEEKIFTSITGEDEIERTKIDVYVVKIGGSWGVLDYISAD